MYLRHATASQEVPLGYFVDSTDGNTEETGLTIANTDIKLWKEGATTLANKNSGGGTHISNGIYYAVLDATDTNTVGNLVIFVHVTGALAIRLEATVLEEQVYDSLVAGSDLLDISMTQILGTAVSTPATAGILDVNLKNIANAAVSTSTAQLGVNAVQIGAAVPGSATIGTVTNLTNLPAAAATAAELAKVPKSDGTSSWNATALAAINAEVDTALNTAIPGSPTANSINERVAAIDDLTQAAGGGDLAAVKTQLANVHDTDLPAVKTETAAIKAKTDNLPAAPAATGDIPTAAAITDAVWDEVLHTAHEVASSASVLLQGAGTAGDPWTTALPGAYGAGTAGKIVGDNLNAPVGTVDTVVDAIKAKTDNLPAAPAAVGDIPTAAAIVDATWDEVLHTAHEVASSASVLLQGAGTAGDPWTTALPGAYGAGTAGKIVGDNLNAPVGTVDTVVDGLATTLNDVHNTDLPAVKSVLDNVHDTDLPAVKTETAAIKTQTDKLAFTVANQVDANVIDWKGSAAPAMTGDAYARLGAPAGASVSADVAAVKAETAAIVADTNELQGEWANGGRLDLILDAASTLTAAQVNAEVVDVLRTDTIPDSVSTDGSQPTIAQALYMILQYLTEQSISSTTMTVKKPDGTTTLFTLTLDSATTPTSKTRAS